MTFKEAIENGYTLADSTFFKGYVSRKIDISKQLVKTASGKRKGQLFVELPNWKSSYYSIRQYLIKGN